MDKTADKDETEEKMLNTVTLNCEIQYYDVQNADLNQGVTDILEDNDLMSISTTADWGRNGFCTADVINIKQDTLENSSEGDSLDEGGPQLEHKLLEDSLGFKNGLGAEFHGIAG